MRHLEHTLQRNMVNLFRMAYPQYKGVFFAVPNGGHRDNPRKRLDGYHLNNMSIFNY